MSAHGRSAIGAVALLAALMAVAPGAAGAEMVGRTAIVVEQVTGTLGPSVRRLVIRDDVNRNELVATAPKSASELVFLDGTTVSLGPSSELTLDDLVYDPRPSREKLAVRFVEGAFRFVTGAFSKGAYRIDTPTATIGVRGTSFRLFVRPQATLVQVYSGQVISTNKSTGETTSILPGQTFRIRSGGNAGSSITPATADGKTDDETAWLAELDQMDNMLQTAMANGNGVSPDSIRITGPLPFSNQTYGGTETVWSTANTANFRVVSPNGLR